MYLDKRVNELDNHEFVKISLLGVSQRTSSLPTTTTLTSVLSYKNQTTKEINRFWYLYLYPVAISIAIFFIIILLIIIIRCIINKRREIERKNLINNRANIICDSNNTIDGITTTPYDDTTNIQNYNNQINNSNDLIKENILLKEHNLLDNNNNNNNNNNSKDPLNYGTLNSSNNNNNCKQEQKRMKISITWPFLNFFQNILSFNTNKTKHSKTEHTFNNALMTNNNDINSPDLMLDHATNSNLSLNYLLPQNMAAAADTANSEPTVLNYSINYTKSTLKVTINSVDSIRSLTTITNTNNFNPYVKIELVDISNSSETSSSSISTSEQTTETESNQFKAVKTRTIRNTTNPKYDELFEFNNIDNLIEYDLLMCVYSSNLFTRDLFIGQYIHKFEVIDDNENVTFEQSYSVKLDQSNKNLIDKNNYGEITMSLCYKADTRKICLTIIKAKNLIYLSNNNLPNPFIKLYFIYKNERISKKISKILMQTRDPIYNQTFEFDFDSLKIKKSSATSDIENENENKIDNNNNNNNIDDDLLNDISLNLLIFDWNPIEKCQLLGKLVFSNNNELCRLETIRQHWIDVFNNPNKQLSATYKLMPPIATQQES